MTIEKAIKSGAAKLVRLKGKPCLKKGNKYLPLTEAQYSQLKSKQ